MVRPKFTRRTGPMITGYHTLQLMCGADLFRHLRPAYGEDVAAMRRDWADASVREAVRTRHAKKWGPYAKPWADLALGPSGRGGTVRTAADIPSSRLAYERQRDAAYTKHLAETVSAENDG